VLGALGALDFAVILPFIAGCLVGVMAFSRLVSWLLHHYYRISVLVITGILTGSLWMIWPFQLREYVMVRDKPRLIASHPHIPESFTGEQWLALALAIIGFGLVMLLHRTAQRKKHPERKA
ncbi:MAG: undecaprenyl phosphate translocase family protein, partial [Rickettsiales bacterium]